MTPANLGSLSGSPRAASARPVGSQKSSSFLRDFLRREAAVADIDKRAERRYRVRYRDPSGRERSKTFPRLAQARRFKATV